MGRENFDLFRIIYFGKWGGRGFGLPSLLVICDGATGRLCWSKCRGNVASGPPLFLSIWWSLSDSAGHRAGGKKGEAWTGQDDTDWKRGFFPSKAKSHPSSDPTSTAWIHNSVFHYCPSRLSD